MATIRLYIPADFSEWRRMRTALWPEQTESDMQRWLARADAAILVAERAGGQLCGFAEVGERSHADGCDSSPLAYLEGWYVDPDQRRQSVGTKLIHAAENWARGHGYRELASDTTLDNTISQTAHERLGFTETDRCVLYLKTL